MDSLVEARVKGYLKHKYHYDPVQIGKILFNIRRVAHAGGYALDERFARAGLGAGVEARTASEVVDRALGGGGGNCTGESHMKAALDKWIRTTGQSV
ncbi:MAG: hypothetical protein ACYTHJ_03785 [Planctomycetota bacterium]|jgi:hypothetical protein